MKQILALSVGAIVALTAFGLGVLHYWNTYEPRISELNADIKTLQLEKELEEIRRAKQQDAIAYRLKKAELEQQQAIRTAEPVKFSLIVALTVKNLWPVWVLIFIGTGAVLFAYSRKQTTTQELAKAQQALIFQSEEHTATVIERVLPSYARMLARQKPEPIVEAIPVDEASALRAFSGNVHFSQAALDEDFDPEAILMGRNIETGGLCQIPLDELQSLCVNGLQKQGKSVLLLALAHQALYRKYVLQEEITIVPVDIHGGYPDSLLTRLDELLPNGQQLFDRRFSGEDEIERGLVPYLDSLIACGKAARNASERSFTLILFDEYTETVTALAAGRDIEARIKRLFNYRKAGINLALAMFEGGKNQNSAKGLNVSKMSVSKALFKTASDEGSRFFNGGNEAAALDKGEYLLLLPGMAEPERIKAPLFSAIDFAPFAKFLASELQNGNRASEVDSPKPSEQPLTPDIVKRFLGEHNMSQNALAKKARLSKSDLSRWMNGKNISGEKRTLTVAALQPIVQPQKSGKVISLQHYRNTPQDG